MKIRRIISKTQNHAGMTMIEVTIAGVILMGAVITMMTMFDTALNILRFTTSRSLATQIGNEVLEDFRSLDYPQAVLYDSGAWPQDDPDFRAGPPPEYKDADNEWRSLLTTDTAAALQVEESRERQHINFTIRRYVFYVPDGTNLQAFKRLVVKVKWTNTDSPGEVVLTTNYAKEDKGESRPLGKMLGVRSTNYNYFSAMSEETTMGLDDSIRGPQDGGVITPVVWTEAVVTGAKASYIDRVEYQLWDPDGTTLVKETTVESDSVDAIDGRYFKWPLNTTSPALADGAGYLIRAESFDNLGRSDVDGMRINIDNTPPQPPSASTDNYSGKMRIRVYWTWSDLPGSIAPERTRFNIRRSEAGSGAGPEQANYAAISSANATGTTGNQWSFMDAGLKRLKYNYWVKAIDSAGNTSEHNAGDKDKFSDPTPVAVNAVTNATAEAVSWKAMTIGWSQAFNGPGSGYHWEARDASGSSWTKVASIGDTWTDPVFFTDGNLKPGKTYEYRVKAFDDLGNFSSLLTLPAVSTPMR